MFGGLMDGVLNRRVIRETNVSVEIFLFDCTAHPSVSTLVVIVIPYVGRYSPRKWLKAKRPLQVGPSAISLPPEAHLPEEIPFLRLVLRTRQSHGNP